MKVAIFGICGKMGRAIGKELLLEDGIELVGGLDKESIGKDIGSVLGKEETGTYIYDSYKDFRQFELDAVIDFTVAEVAVKSIDWAIKNKIDIIVGTTGISEIQLKCIEDKARKSDCKVLIVPNFSIGALLMVKMSGVIARYFDNCEIIELHHDNKNDAPSGTSVKTSEVISKSKLFNSQRLKKSENETLDGSRGAFLNGIHIHSVRLPGLLAHQKIIFGSKGQTLSIEHDTTDRNSFYPGVLMALKNLNNLKNYTYGLDEMIEI